MKNLTNWWWWPVDMVDRPGDRSHDDRAGHPTLPFWPSPRRKLNYIKSKPLVKADREGKNPSRKGRRRNKTRADGSQGRPLNQQVSRSPPYDLSPLEIHSNLRLLQSRQASECDGCESLGLV